MPISLIIILPCIHVFFLLVWSGLGIFFLQFLVVSFFHSYFWIMSYRIGLCSMINPYFITLSCDKAEWITISVPRFLFLNALPAFRDIFCKFPINANVKQFSNNRFLWLTVLQCLLTFFPFPFLKHSSL